MQKLGNHRVWDVWAKLTQLSLSFSLKNTVAISFVFHQSCIWKELSLCLRMSSSWLPSTVSAGELDWLLPFFPLDCLCPCAFPTTEPPRSMSLLEALSWGRWWSCIHKQNRASRLWRQKVCGWARNIHAHLAVTWSACWQIGHRNIEQFRLEATLQIMEFHPTK